MSLITDLLEYVERYADLNDEPEGGHCRRLIAEARAAAPTWFLFIVGDGEDTTLLSVRADTESAAHAAVLALARDVHNYSPEHLTADFVGMVDREVSEST